MKGRSPIRKARCRPPGYGPGVIDHVIHRDRHGRVVALDHHAERIAGQHNIDPGFIEQLGEAGIVGGQAGCRLRRARAIALLMGASWSTADIGIGRFLPPSRWWDRRGPDTPGSRRGACRGACGWSARAAPGPARQVRPPDAPLEKGVARKRRGRGGEIEHEAPGAVSGNVPHPDLLAERLQDGAVVEPVVDLDRLDREARRKQRPHHLRGLVERLVRPVGADRDPGLPDDLRRPLRVVPVPVGEPEAPPACTPRFSGPAPPRPTPRGGRSISTAWPVPGSVMR